MKKKLSILKIINKLNIGFILVVLFIILFWILVIKTIKGMI